MFQFMVLLFSDMNLEGDVDSLRLEKPKMAVVEVFLEFLIISGRMRAPNQKSLTCTDAAFIQIHISKNIMQIQ